LTWCNEELECLGLADREGENIRPLAEELSICEPTNKIKGTFTQAFSE
jgi:hypothetical protein